METIRIPGNLYYLTAQFPPRYKVYEKCAKRLNDKGFKTNSGGMFTKDNVSAIIRGVANDIRVELELEAMLAELRGKTKLVQAHMKAIYEILELEVA